MARSAFIDRLPLLEGEGTTLLLAVLVSSLLELWPSRCSKLSAASASEASESIIINADNYNQKLLKGFEKSLTSMST